MDIVPSPSGGPPTPTADHRRRVSFGKRALMAMAGVATGLLAEFVSGEVGLQSALTWNATAVIFTVLSLVPALALWWTKNGYWRAFAAGLAAYWLVLALLWFWGPDPCPYVSSGPGEEGGCSPGGI